MGKTKFTVSDIKAAIARVGTSPNALADELGCSRNTVQKYLREWPHLVAGADEEPQTRYTREAFVAAIAQSHGVKSSVAALVGCSRQTVDNALRRWPELREMLDAERSRLIGSSVNALYTDVVTPASEGHQRAYMFVLRTLGKDEGFAERQEITGANGEALFAPDVLELLQRMGKEPSEVVRQFETMIRTLAAQQGIA